MPIVTLITDFGTSDGYVGEVKGAILSEEPGVTLVDVAHDVPPGDVEAAAWILSRVWHRYPTDNARSHPQTPGRQMNHRDHRIQSCFRRWDGMEPGGRR